MSGWRAALALTLGRWISTPSAMPAPDPTVISGLHEVADRYGALLCDIWGVVHNGEERFAGACETLLRFNATRGPVVLISNSPRPSPDVDDQLRTLDVPSGAYAAIVTSGDVTRHILAERGGQRVWIVGPDRDAGLYQGLPLEASGVEDAEFISCTGLFDDEVETPDDYRERLQTARARNLVMVCANPDRVVQRGGRLIYCAGALAALYESLGGQTIMAGKPFAPIYDQALAEVARLAGEDAALPTLAVGDGLHTDVLGANRRGLDCLLIAEGVHGGDLIDERGELQPWRLAAALAEAEAHAAFALKRLAW